MAKSPFPISNLRSVQAFFYANNPAVAQTLGDKSLERSVCIPVCLCVHTSWNIFLVKRNSIIKQFLFIDAIFGHQS